MHTHDVYISFQNHKLQGRRTAMRTDPQRRESDRFTELICSACQRCAAYSEKTPSATSRRAFNRPTPDSVRNTASGKAQASMVSQ